MIEYLVVTLCNILFLMCLQKFWFNILIFDCYEKWSICYMFIMIPRFFVMDLIESIGILMLCSFPDRWMAKWSLHEYHWWCQSDKYLQDTRVPVKQGTTLVTSLFRRRATIFSRQERRSQKGYHRIYRGNRVSITNLIPHVVLAREICQIFQSYFSFSE